MTEKAFILFILLAGAGAMQTARGEVAVIVNSSNSIAQLDVDTVNKIFLGKTQSFPAGSKAEPVDHKEGAALRDEFYQKVTAKDAAQIKAYWAKLIFSGKGVPPQSLASDEEIKAWIAKNPAGIAYIDAKNVDASVKTVLSIP